MQLGAQLANDRDWGGAIAITYLTTPVRSFEAGGSAVAGVNHAFPFTLGTPFPVKIEALGEATEFDETDVLTHGTKWSLSVSFLEADGVTNAPLQAAEVPEPASLALVCAGICGVCLARRFCNRAGIMDPRLRTPKGILHPPRRRATLSLGRRTDSPFRSR